MNKLWNFLWKLALMLGITILFVETCVGPVKMGTKPIREAGLSPTEYTAKVSNPDFDLKTEGGMESLFGNFGPPYKVTETKESGNTEIHINFLREIVDIDAYEPLIEKINQLTKNDKLVLHFSNFGGSVYTGAALFNALVQTPADVKAIIEAPSFSMGAMLPCAADSIEIKPFSFLMYHDYSGGTQGKGSEMLEQLKAFDVLVLKMLNQCVAHGVLTSEQVIDIKGGKDVYVHPEGVK